MIREFYAIRHKPTAGFLPEVGVGYTHSEPSTTAVPRLFTTKGGAQRALTWWLKGVHWVTHSTRFDYDYESFWDYDEEWHDKHMPERKPEDMEVIPVLLKV